MPVSKLYDNLVHWRQTSLTYLVFSAVLILCVLLAFSMLHAASSFIESVSMIQVFSSDEQIAVSQVAENLQQGDLDPRGFYNYGYLYHSFSIFCIRSLSLLKEGPLDSRFIAHIMRLISVIFFFLSGMLLYKTSIQLGISKTLAIIFSLIFLSYNKYVYWGWHIHPDILQTFLVILSFFVLLRIEKETLSLACCGLFLGMAFGTKYSGVFGLIVPVFIIISRKYYVIRVEKSVVSFFRSIAFDLTVVISGFLFGWLIFNPYVLLHPLDFLADFVSESRHVARGHGKAESGNGFLWVNKIRTSLSWSMLSFLSISVAALFFGIKGFIADIMLQKKEQLLDRNRAFVYALLSYVSLCSLHLFFLVNMRVIRFTFHIWPTVVLLSAFSLNYYTKKLPQKWRFASKSIVVIILALLTLPIFATNSKNIARELEIKRQSPLLLAGDWLKKNYPRDTRIFGGYYSYIPDDYFQNSDVSFKFTLKTINEFNPDVLVLNKKIPGRYIWKKKGTMFKDGEFAISKLDLTPPHVECLKYLLSENSPYTISFENDDVLILEKKKSSNGKG